MGLALPLALLALAGVAMPIVAHLIRRRELPRVELPTILLLEEAVADSHQRRRIEDPLLLALRIGLLAAAAVAFAAPFVEVSIAEGDGRAAALVVVVDSSLSMGAHGDGRTLLEDAVRRTTRAIERLPDGSEITVLTTGTPSRVVVDRMRVSSRARDAVRAASYVPTGGDTLARTVELGVRKLAASTLSERRLLVLSDFAEHVDTTAMHGPSGTHVEFVRIAPESTENAGVAVARVEDDSDGGHGFRVHLDVVSNLGRAIDVSIVDAGGAVRGAARVPAERGTHEVIVHVSEGSSERAVAFARLGVSDALALDDEAEFELRAPSEVRVLFVDGDPRPSRRDDEVGFASRALELAPLPEGRFRVRTVDANRFGAAALLDADVVVLANVAHVPTPVARALAEFISEGGGLWFATGDRTNGATLDEALRAILPARIGARVATPPVGVIVDRTTGSFDARGLSSTHVVAHHTLEPTLGARVSARLDDGTPWIVSGTHGNGRVLVLGSALDDADSDLPLRASFLPAVIRFARELGPTRESTEAVATTPLRESSLEPGTVPRPGAGRGSRGGSQARLRRDVSPFVFVLLGLCVAAEGILRAARRASQNRASTTRAIAP